MNKKSTLVAYLLWLPPMGFMGFHKFYLGKPFMGVLYFLTGGLAAFGWIYDLFTLPRQVELQNLLIEDRIRRYQRRKPVSNDDEAMNYFIRELVNASREEANETGKEENPEKIILKIAYDKNGKVTVGDIAVNSNLSLEQAEQHLKKLAEKGYCGMNITENGMIVYEFQNLFSKQGAGKYIL